MTTTPRKPRRKPGEPRRIASAWRRGRSAVDVARYKALLGVMDARGLTLASLIGPGVNSKQAVAYRLCQAADPTSRTQAQNLEWLCTGTGISRRRFTRAMDLAQSEAELAAAANPESAPAEPITDNDNDCDNDATCETCAGSGGGPGPELACPSCRGVGAHPVDADDCDPVEPEPWDGDL